MSLLSEAMTTCILYNKTRTADGEGGFVNVWAEGAEFNAAIVLDTSTEARIAEKSGVSNLYTITTARNNSLEFHDVFKRKSDGKIFRVTSDGTEKKTPASASLSMSQVSAEEWTLQ